MAKDLKVYNHLNYNDQPSDGDDGFVEFLMQQTDSDAPEVDIDVAWNTVSAKAKSPAATFNWLKIAASVAILAILSASLYFYNLSPNQLYVSSADETISIEFPDGSLGTLNAQSSFSYPEWFEDTRSISLTGEAYFDIKKSKKPFIIDVNGVEVRVLGTAFNLISSDDEVKLFVDRGLVAFEKNGVQTKVPAGTEAIFDRRSAQVEILAAPTANIMSWRNGVFMFDQTPLEVVLDELSDYYNVQFELSNDKLNTCRISATFNKQPLNEVLSTIGSILNVQTSRKDDTIKISGQGC